MLHENANAKINLFLDITGRRENGYHELHSCMQTVGLSDTISADIHEAENTQTITIQCSDPTLPTDERNLVWRAAQMYMQEANIPAYNLDIRIEKRIPVFAGLGGGSADAAAILRLLNRHYKNALSMEQLLALGAKLGADVPFCIHGGTCQCEGIGDILTPIVVHPDYTVLIAKNGDGVSTSEAFRMLDEAYATTPHEIRSAEKVYSALAANNAPALRNCTYNAFEEVILPIRPLARELKDIMNAYGAVCTQMSGSGPSVFGIFLSDARAEVCASTLPTFCDIRQSNLYSIGVKCNSSSPRKAQPAA